MSWDSYNDDFSAAMLYGAWWRSLTPAEQAAHTLAEKAKEDASKREAAELLLAEKVRVEAEKIQEALAAERLRQERLAQAKKNKEKMGEMQKSPVWGWVDRIEPAFTKKFDAIYSRLHRLESEKDGLESLNRDAVAVMAQAEGLFVPLKLLAQQVARDGGLGYFGGWVHTSSQPGQAKHWVIRGDGSHRPYDSEEYSRSHQRGEQTHWWRKVEGDEVALRWGKGSRASSHNFSVAYAPKNLSDAQVRAMLELENELECTWLGATGMTGRTHCPSVGGGWGLVPAKVRAASPLPSAAEIARARARASESISLSEVEAPVVAPTPVAQGGVAASVDALATLRARFAK